MKRILTLCIVMCTMITSYAQDTTATKNSGGGGDTIHIGGMIIIRKGGATYREKDNRPSVIHHARKQSNISTNWWIVDLGLSNFNDKTNYAGTGAQQYAPGSNRNWFDLRDGKSVNVNFWFFMQKINIAKHILNFKYGLGLELNNYRYKQNIRYIADPPPIANPARIILDGTVGRTYQKDKLAADYLTLPVMLNFNFTPKRHDGFGFSSGISVGYLYSARNKTITSDEGKKKAKDDFELQKWKLAYIGELSLGPVHLYGSYALKSMYTRGLDMTPYTIGFRFSNW